jgi:hypothetical protein
VSLRRAGLGYPAAMKRVLTLVLATACVALTATSARADEPGPPSVFTYTSNGFMLGGMVGLAAGYLVARDDGFEDEDWRPLVIGTGIGAVVGGTLGLTLGVVDMARETPGYGGYVLRETMYGAGFGAIVGALIGGVAVASTKKSEHIAFGAAIGTLAGSGLGVVLGFVEGSHAGAGRRSARSLTIALGAAPATNGGAVWLPGLAGAF